jgi:CRP-like cAMP-binding protein
MKPAISSHHRTVFASLLGQEPDMDFAAGDVLFHIQDSAEYALYLISGRVAVVMVLANGRRFTIAERVGQELVGEMGLVSGQRFCEVRALEPVRAVRISYAAITQLVNARADFALALYTLANERLEEACRVAADQGQTAPHRS